MSNTFIEKLEEKEESVRKSLSDLVNVMGSDSNLKSLAEKLTTKEHRYLQQQLFLNFICPMLENWNQAYRDGRYDDRNEFTCRVCKDLVDVLKNTR